VWLRGRRSIALCAVPNGATGDSVHLRRVLASVAGRQIPACAGTGKMGDRNRPDYVRRAVSLPVNVENVIAVEA
jgi:hypothetical protein